MPIESPTAATRRSAVVPILSFALAVLAGCGGGPRTLASYDFSNRDGLIATPEEATIDPGENGNPSLKVVAKGESLVNLYNIEPGDVAGDVIEVTGRVRTEMLLRGLYLDLWIFPKEGKARMVRQFQAGVHATVDWTDLHMMVPLRQDESPAKLRVAVYVDGAGKYWLDDLVVRAGPAEAFESGK